MRASWARSGQYLHGWAGLLQMVSEPIPDPDVGVYSVWPRNPMGHNEDVVSAWGGGGGGGVFVTSHIGYGGNFLTLYKYGLLST